MIKGSRNRNNNCKFLCPSIIRAPQYIRQTLFNTKEENNSNTIIVGKFNIPLKSMDRSSIKKNQ